MASKELIKERQSTLKKYLISENLTSVDFYLHIEPLYKKSWFKEKFGKVSQSRMRHDLKSIGYVYNSKEKNFTNASAYSSIEAESEIVKCLFFMNLYRPISVDLIPFDFYETPNCKLSYIFLNYEKPKDRTYAKYSIKYLLKNLSIYYDYMYSDSCLGELNIITTEKYIKFEFLDSQALNHLYENLEKWKLKSKKQNPFVRRKVGRIR